MAKAQTRYATNASNDLINQAKGLTDPLYSSFQTSLGGAQGRQTDVYNTLFPALTEFTSTGGYDPEQLTNLRGETQQFANTGGYDPTQLAKIEGGYGDFATTGGFTPTQEQDFVRQATEGTTSTYNALQDQAKRAIAATGGLGTTGALSQMARQGGQAQAKNTLDAKVALSGEERAGKIAGLKGLESTEGEVAGAKRAGLGAQLGLESGVARGKEQAGGMLNTLFNTQTGEVSQLGNKLLETLGLRFNTQAEAIAALTKLSQNKGFFSTLLGDLEEAGGAAAGAYGALFP